MQEHLGTQDHASSPPATVQRKARETPVASSDNRAIQRRSASLVQARAGAMQGAGNRQVNRLLADSEVGGSSPTVQRREAREIRGNVMAPGADREQFVRRIQERLEELGHLAPGSYQPGQLDRSNPQDPTAAAIREFQQRHAEEIGTIRADSARIQGGWQSSSGGRLPDAGEHSTEGEVELNDATAQALANAWPRRFFGVRLETEADGFQYLAAEVRRLGLPFDRLRVNVVGIRGFQGGEAHDNPNVRRATNRYDDTLAVLCLDDQGEPRMREFKGTTDPGGRSRFREREDPNTAQMVAGQQVEYRYGGTFKGNLPTLSPGAAVTQVRPPAEGGAPGQPPETGEGAAQTAGPADSSAAGGPAPTPSAEPAPEQQTGIEVVRGNGRHARRPTGIANHSGGASEEVQAFSTGCQVVHGSWYGSYIETIRRGLAWERQRQGGTPPTREPLSSTREEDRIVYSLLEGERLQPPQAAGEGGGAPTAGAARPADPQATPSAGPAQSPAAEVRTAQELQRDLEAGGLGGSVGLPPAAGSARSGAPVQHKGHGQQAPEPAEVHAAARAGVADGGGPLPFADRIQEAFGGHDLSRVRAHVGGRGAAAAAQMGASAYATGEDVVFGETPDLRTAAHEAAHIIQQRGGGLSLPGGVGQAGDRHEQLADRVADAVVAGRSAEGLLGAGKAGAAQGQRRKSRSQGSIQRNSPRNLPRSQQGVSEAGRVNRGERLDLDRHHTGLSSNNLDGGGADGTPRTLRQTAEANRDELIRQHLQARNPQEVQQRIEVLRRSGDPAQLTQATELEQQLRVIEQHALAEALNPAESERYDPGDNTYCNYYARDYMEAMGVDIGGGSANTLNDTFTRSDKRHQRSLRRGGTGGGWREVATMEEAQQLANQGRLVVISAQGITSPGHISVVLGELGDTGPGSHERVRRRQTETLLVPLQSQAGSQGHRETRGTRGNEVWWSDGRHRNGHAYVFEGERSQDRVFREAAQADAAQAGVEVATEPPATSDPAPEAISTTPAVAPAVQGDWLDPRTNEVLTEAEMIERRGPGPWPGFVEVSGREAGVSVESGTVDQQPAEPPPSLVRGSVEPPQLSLLLADLRDTILALRRAVSRDTISAVDAAHGRCVQQIITEQGIATDQACQVLVARYRQREGSELADDLREACGDREDAHRDLMQRLGLRDPTTGSVRPGPPEAAQPNNPARLASQPNHARAYAAAVRQGLNVGLFGSTWEEFAAKVRVETLFEQPLVGHEAFLERVRRAEAHVHEEHPDWTPDEIKQRIRIIEVPHSQLRLVDQPGDSNGNFKSYHSFGFAVDINRFENQWVACRSQTQIQAFARMAQLFSRPDLAVRVQKTNRVREGSTEAIFSHFAEADAELQRYFNLASANDEEVARYLERSAGGAFSGRTALTARALRQQARRDRALFVNRQNPEGHFMTHSRALVIGLRDRGGLAWGACDQGRDNHDMMHFDGRNIDNIRIFRQALDNLVPRAPA